jgi:hypothetical protein
MQSLENKWRMNFWRGFKRSLEEVVADPAVLVVMVEMAVQVGVIQVVQMEVGAQMEEVQGQALLTEDRRQVLLGQIQVVQALVLVVEMLQEVNETGDLVAHGMEDRWGVREVGIYQIVLTEAKIWPQEAEIAEELVVEEVILGVLETLEV